MRDHGKASSLELGTEWPGTRLLSAVPAPSPVKALNRSHASCEKLLTTHSLNGYESPSYK